MRRYRFITRMVGLLIPLALGAWACDDSSPTEPPVQVAANIEIEPAQVFLVSIGEQEQLSATVYDEDGEVISDAEVTWISSEESVATVDEDGVVEAVGSGTATITAQSGDITASAEVTVEIED
jgi:uncharacterized protein YjdB